MLMLMLMPMPMPMLMLMLMLIVVVQIQSQSPDGDIVTPGNFDKHMEAQPTHRLLKKERYSDKRYKVRKHVKV